MAQIDKFLELLLRYGGSDLHLAVGVSPMLRVDGDLRRIDYGALTREQMIFLLSEIMTSAHQVGLEKDYDVDFAYEAEGLGRFRVNAFTQKNGPSAVLRVVPTKIPTPDDIGLPAAVRQLAMKHQGLVLITGATGSGKSTTLASLVDIINKNRPAHIITIEDPIEFVHKSQKSLVSQREVGQHALGFSRALRAALREDPDVILVGEMRDIETIALAMTAAETGHLVLATLHTSSAPKTVDRVIDSFPHEQQQQIRVQLAEGLAAIIAQQLLPRRDGSGRIAAYEVLLNNNAVANQIREGKIHQLRSLMQMHKREGMQIMDAALADLVRRGAVDVTDALARAHDRKYLEQDLARDGALNS